MEQREGVAASHELIMDTSEHAYRLADPPAEVPTTHRLTPRIQQFLRAANTSRS